MVLKQMTIRSLYTGEANCPGFPASPSNPCGEQVYPRVRQGFPSSFTTEEAASFENKPHSHQYKASQTEIAAKVSCM